MGRYQRDFLQQQGLLPEHRLLDIGCGSLRAGCWLIPTSRATATGIEPNRVMLRFGREILLKPELLSLKRPSFDHNTRDFSVFGASLTSWLAPSGATPRTSDSEDAAAVQGHQLPGQFFASYLPATEAEVDYGGEAWVGRSHRLLHPRALSPSDLMDRQCEALGWSVRVDEPAINDQVWFKFEPAGQERLIRPCGRVRPRAAPQSGLQ